MKTWQIFLIAFFSILLLAGCLAICAGGKKGPKPLPDDHPWHLSQDERIPTKTNKYPQPLRPKRHPSTEDDPEDSTEMFKELNKFKMKRDTPLYCQWSSNLSTDLND
ncbi:uncharacterized protein FIESC28_08493 [Fusarium coffeatum]|uniref:Uncharacterized protein n=1 Tax=Fusarium coffeatum TaxID=231269 RepID=A0A366R6K2_9HYPO|nr:uncharacterized protein FIESC28_08493 [Fusarium coffeatum]RBR12791.1 hypothetical protein FIESC28_08493 [Fusarium coffeatum]